MRKLLHVAAAALLCAGCKKSAGASMTVGPSGAIFSLPGGPSIAVPEGALAKGVTLTVQQSLPQAQAPAGALSAVYTFGPEGTVFAKPVTITMPVPAGTAGATLFWTRPGSTTAYDAVPSLLSATTLIAQVMHFSAGFAGAACRTGGGCTSSNACHTGISSCETGTAVCTDAGNQPDGTTASSSTRGGR